ncbi:MAG: hypothetical protein WC326_02195 [Candidatus Delongbacteria bacterium]
MSTAPALSQQLMEHLPVPIFLENGAGPQPQNRLARQLVEVAGGVPAAVLEGAWELQTEQGRLLLPGLKGEERRRAEQYQSFGRYTGGIVHNLNNPLNALSGMIQLMMFRNSDLPELERLDRQTEELANQIRYLGDRYRRLQEYERGAPLTWELVISEELRFFRADSVLKHRCQLELEVAADVACPLSFRDASWLLDRMLEAILLLVPGEGMYPLRLDLLDGWPQLRLSEPNLNLQDEALGLVRHPLMVDLLHPLGLSLRWRVGSATAELAVTPIQA